jgi:hypothetical protein
VRESDFSPIRTSFESSWQNGIAERWVESCRRDLLDHIIAVNECHLKRLLSEYLRYYHEDRTHLGLGKETPDSRIGSSGSGCVLSRQRLGGLHHRYDRGPDPELSFHPSLYIRCVQHMLTERPRAPQTLHTVGRENRTIFRADGILARDKGSISDSIIHSFAESLLATQVFLCRLYRDVAKEKLNLFQFAT